MTPQVQTLLTHLQNHGSISQAEAGTVYKIRALPRRIADLKAEGYEITRELKTDPTGQRYARYHFVGKKPKEGDTIEIVSIDGDEYGAPAQGGRIYKVGQRAVITTVVSNINRVIAEFPQGTWYVSLNDLKVIPNGN